MIGFFRKGSGKAGLPPGTLVHVGEKRAEKVRIDMVGYDKDGVERKSDIPASECRALIGRFNVVWFNITGVHDVDVIGEFGKGMGFHPLLMEDIVHTGQRPKLEDFGEYLFVVLKMLRYDTEAGGLHVEQVSLIIGPGYVISFQETKGDVFDPVRERIQKGKGKLRTLGSDYLAHALMDSIIDNYFVILERFGEITEELQDAVLSEPTPETLKAIHETKRDALFLRKSVWPLREAIRSLEGSESTLMTPAVAPYLRDLYDHTIQVIDGVETIREMISGIMDVYLTNVSNRMNEVMKVLTVIATIFIPLTFIVGVYGMNFKYMPELDWPWAYPLVWLIMVGIGVVMVVLFRKKMWI